MSNRSLCGSWCFYFTHCCCFYLDVYAYIEVPLKLQLKCLIPGVYTCFYLVGNLHEAFQEIEEEEPFSPEACVL